MEDEEDAELYLPEDDCAAGGTCPGEGVFIPQVLHNRDMDALFVGSDADTQADLGLAEVDSYPLSDEMIPVIYDGAHLTLDGVIDCFARKYPERASLLCALIEKENFRIQWHEAPEAEAAALRDRLNNMRPADWGMNSPMFSSAQRAERSRIYDQISTLSHWGFDGTTLHIHSRINRNIDATTFFRDDPSLINWNPTNAEGADWLNAVMGDWMVRSGVPGARSDEEFADNRRSRIIWGTLNVVFGAAEIIGGVVLMGGTLGVGTVAGGAMTIAGFEAITQGIDMWRTPNASAHATGWLGDGARAMLTEFGVINQSDQSVFNSYWSFAMLGLSLGGTGVMGFAGRTLRAGQGARLASRFDFIADLPARGLANARMAIVAVRNSRFGQFVINFAPLPSGRIVMKLNGIGRMVAPAWESLPRLRLRLHTMSRSKVVERARRLAAGEAGLLSLRGGLNSVGDANKLVREVAAFMGISERRLARLIEGVRLGPANRSSALTTDLRIRIRADAGFARYLARRRPPRVQHNEFVAMSEAFHELHHAIEYRKWIASGRSRAEYFSARPDPATQLRRIEEEILVETAARDWTERMGRPRVARERHYGNAAEADRLDDLLADAIDNSNLYIEHYQELRRRLLGGMGQ